LGRRLVVDPIVGDFLDAVADQDVSSVVAWYPANPKLDQVIGASAG
jgi:hypothetical protein